jgi:hypothetical protein
LLRQQSRDGFPQPALSKRPKLAPRIVTADDFSADKGEAAVKRGVADTARVSAFEAQ